MARRAPAGTPAILALEKRGVSFSVHAYEHDPARVGYGWEAAEALGLEPETVLKTLLAEADGELVVGIVPVSSQLDLKSLAAALGAKRATMADPVAAARATGYVVGGISPIGQKRRLRTVVDESVLDHPVVYVSGGRRGLDLGLSPADLISATDGTAARIRRDRA